jgi:hypothetical protein
MLKQPLSRPSLRPSTARNAEQEDLYKRHPATWVAPPGKSPHRLGTELDGDRPPRNYGYALNGKPLLSPELIRAAMRLALRKKTPP